jgi:hypothetical protein
MGFTHYDTKDDFLQIVALKKGWVNKTIHGLISHCLFSLHVLGLVLGFLGYVEFL